MTEVLAPEEAWPKMREARWSETEDAKEWDEFVSENRGSIFHTWAWRRVLESDGSRPFYLAYRNGRGSILAICPFFYRTRGRLRYLYSLPNSYMAGPVISNRAPAASQIITSLRKSVNQSLFNPVVYMRVKVHHEPIVRSMITLGFNYELKDEFLILDLHEKKPEDIWEHGFRKHDRQAIKYYESQGSRFGLATRETEFRDFLSLLPRNYIGRIHSADFFSRMRLNMGERLCVATVTSEGKAITGISMLCDPPNSTIHLTTIRYAPTKNIHSPVTYLNWKVVNWAAEHGFRYVNFGDYTIAKCADPTHPFHRLKERFEAASIPRYLFTLPVASVLYSVAKTMNQAP